MCARLWDAPTVANPINQRDVRTSNCTTIPTRIMEIKYMITVLMFSTAGCNTFDGPYRTQRPNIQSCSHWGVTILKLDFRATILTLDTSTERMIVP